MRAFRALFSAAWRYSAGRRGRMALYISLFIAANAVHLLEPVIIGRMLNTIQEIWKIPEPLKTLGFYFAMMIGLQFGFWILHGPARVMEISNAFHAKNTFADELFHIITSLPIQWHKDNHSGQTINKMRKATSALHDFLENGWQLIEMMVRFVGSVTAILILQPVAAVIALSVTTLSLVIVFLFDKILLKQYEKINDREHFTASALHDYVTNIYTVITLRLEALTRSELWKRLTGYYPLVHKNAVLNESKWFLTTIIISLMTVAVLAWYSVNTLYGGGVLLAGTVYMLYDYLQKIGSVFYTFAWKYSQTVQEYADLKAAEDILKAAPALRDAESKLPKDWKEIKIKSLQFSYHDEKNRPHHLSNVALTLQRGKKIALVGESGSGKSTVMSLIRGLHEADEVSVTCDGKELKKGLRHLAHHVTLIPQDPEIFANTIEYNVSVGTEQTEEELLKDIDLARFSNVVKRLPQGLKTDISEKGVNLSGGEKQRLALARGIFAAKQSDILCLDEPTSSVDSMNELRIHLNIFARFHDRAIVASIHRLHLLTLFDEVIVLEKGEVVEHGKPQDLMKGDGLLAKMWKTYQEQHPSRVVAETPAPKGAKIAS